MTKINFHLYGPIAAGALVVLMILLIRVAMAILNFSILSKLQKLQKFTKSNLLHRRDRRGLEVRPWTY
jgi:hypothetical protein